MANKKITDLQLRSSITDTLYFPSDDAIQSYRVSALMLRNYARAFNVVTSTGAYTPVTTDDVILVNTFAAQTLPAASTMTGKVLTLKNVTTGSATISGTIDFVSGYTLNGEGDWIQILSDGAHWRLIGKGAPYSVTESLLTASTSTTAADTWTDVAGSTLALVPGRYDLFFNGTVVAANSSGATAAIQANVGIFDSANTLIREALRYIGSSSAATAVNFSFPVSLIASNVAVATGGTTYKIRVRFNLASPSSASVLGATAITSNLTDPDNYGKFWAVRKA